MGVQLRVLYTNEFDDKLLSSKVVVDKGKICQVIRNLVTNGLQATCKMATKVVTLEADCYYPHEDLNAAVSKNGPCVPVGCWNRLTDWCLCTPSVHPTRNDVIVRDRRPGLKITITDSGVGISKVSGWTDWYTLVS
jgi:signal transduction histidine kinase